MQRKKESFLKTISFYCLILNTFYEIYSNISKKIKDDKLKNT